MNININKRDGRYRSLTHHHIRKNIKIDIAGQPLSQAAVPEIDVMHETMG